MRAKIFIVILTFWLTGCEDFLEEKSQSEIRPSTVTDMEKLLEGEAYFDKNEGLVLNHGTDIFTDDYTCYIVKNRLMETTKEKDKLYYTWDMSMFDDNGKGNDIRFWQGPYNRIKGCNVILEFIDEMSGNEMKRDHLKGEAYTLRGFYYMMLVNFFGLPYNYGDPEKNPGVPLKIVSGVTDEKFSRNSVKECYEQIEKDLRHGAELMAANKEKKSTKKGRLNYLAGYALLSRMFVYTEQWDSVVKYSNLVLQEKPDLLNFEANMKKSVYSIDGERLWTMAEATLDETSSVTGTVHPYALSQDLADVYLRDVDNEVLDLRGAYDKLDYYSTISIAYVKQGFDYYYDASVYVTNWLAAVIKGNESTYWLNGGIRTAEVYLNRAEAYARKYFLSGNQKEANLALEDLNELRRSRFESGYVDKKVEDFADAQTLLDFCFRERRRELCGEGNHRWFDLRRLGMPEIKHVYVDDENGTKTEYVLQAKDPRYALPIPAEMRLKNPNLVQNQY